MLWQKACCRREDPGYNASKQKNHGEGDMPVGFTINGKAASVDVEPDTPLLWVVREHLELTGTKFGCGAGLCGACTVHLDGAATRSCITPMKAAEGKNIVTIEGLAPKADHPVQLAWKKGNVPQCGYCQS